MIRDGRSFLWQFLLEFFIQPSGLAHSFAPATEYALWPVSPCFEQLLEYTSTHYFHLFSTHKIPYFFPDLPLCSFARWLARSTICCIFPADSLRTTTDNWTRARIRENSIWFRSLGTWPNCAGRPEYWDALFLDGCCCTTPTPPQTKKKQQYTTSHGPHLQRTFGFLTSAHVPLQFFINLH